MKNILIVTSGIKGPIKSGGIATAFYNLAVLLKDHNFKVSILYASHPHYDNVQNSPDFWIDYFKEKGIEFIPLEDNTLFYGQDMMKRSYKIYNFLKTNNEKYNKIIFHDHSGIAYYSLLAKKIGLHFENKDMIISAHGNTRLSDYYNRRFPKDHNALITYFLEQKSIEYADYVICPSNFYFSWYREEGYKIKEGFSETIQNVLLLDPDIEKADYLSSNAPTHFCFFGRVEKLKGIFVLLDALDMLITEYPELNSTEKIKVTVIGILTQINGTDIKDYIEERIKRFKFHLQFKTNFNSDEALHYIKEQNGIIINPTLGETSSYTVLEALTYNIRFISSGIEGIKELIEEQYHNEVLFEPGNASQLAKKLYEYHLNPKLGHGQRKIAAQETQTRWIEFLKVPLPSKIKTKGLKKLPTISVCIPTTGKRDIISDTLISLSKQNYKHFEIVIIIDGGDIEIFNNKAKKEIDYIKSNGINITIERVSHRFKPGVCNYAVQKLAKGDYILFFDDDDIAKDNMISTYANVVKNDATIDMISDFCQCFIVDDEKGDKYDFSSEKITLKHLSLGIGNARSANLFINYFGKANFMIKRSKYLELGGMTETSIMTPYVDWDFFVKASANNLNIEIIPEPLYYYRMNSVDSIFYTTHNYQDINGQQRRYLAHKKIIDSIVNSINIDNSLKDYILYAQSKLALPAISKSGQDNLNDLNRLRIQLDDLLWQKEWYESTYERLPWWWKKVGSLIRLVRRFLSKINNK